MKRTPLIFLTLGLALVPSTASANSISSLAESELVHLLVGNALIGLVEGLLLSWMFKAPMMKSILILIAANYVSAWVGAFLEGPLSHLPTFITIENMRVWFFLFVVVAFGLTVLIERPFFRRALRSQKPSPRRIWQAVLLVNAISYLAFCAWYWHVSHTSLMTQLRVVAPGELRPPVEYALYFLSPSGEQIIQTDLHGGEHTVLRTNSDPHDDDRLFAQQREERAYDLLARFEAKERREEIIAKNIASYGPANWEVSNRFRAGPAACFAPTSYWEVSTGYYASHGLIGKHKTTGEQFRYALETPFIQWKARYGTHLEGDYVVYQLGNDQICLLHLASKKIALLARGKRPVVAPQPEISPP